jgi:NADPH-dependent glutamate synthase beta subunit-like oxidoreductase
VCQLALAYEGEDAVERGFADYQRIIGAAEKGVLKSKLEQPGVPENGGRPATQGEPITDFAEAKKAALRAMQAANAS